MHAHPRHVLITGASSGLGAALAHAYAAPPTMLTLIGRDGARLAAVADAASDRGAVVATLRVDVTDRGAIAETVVAADERRPLDLVVANAGVAGDHDAEDVLRINVLGVWHTIAPALARMAPRGSGQLALMSSLAGFRGLPGAATYSASKAAVRVLAEGLRAEWRGRGIRVSAISPGFVDTPLTRRNGFAMPWLLQPDDAARRIVAGLANDRAHIVFPWQLAALARLAAALPRGLADPLLGRARQHRRGRAR